MRVEIISIGNEVLAGAIVDTNSAFMASELYARGQRCQKIQTVADTLPAISEALLAATTRAELVLVSGGLGPTEDDLTAAAAAQAAELPLERLPKAVKLVEAAIAARGLRLTDRQLGQAELPRGCEVIENPQGTAPAFALKLGGSTCLFFPGPPRELRPLVQAQLSLRLPGDEATASRIVRAYGLSEAHLAQQITALHLPASLELGYQVRFPCIDLRLRTITRPGASAKAQLDTAEQALEEALGPVLFGRGSTSYPAFVLEALTQRGLQLGLAESCTGGLVASLLTAEPGASAAFGLGLVSYANRAKQALLGVPEALLSSEGAVSEACALAMAKGARQQAKSDLALAITGLAGPSGGSEEKPIGTVCFAIDGPGEARRSLTLHFHGERPRVQRAAAFSGLELVRQAIGAGVGRSFRSA